jgi:hypothetical protein
MGMLPFIAGLACVMFAGLFVSGGLFLWGRRVAKRQGGWWRRAVWLPVLAWLVAFGGTFGGWFFAAVSRTPLAGRLWTASYGPSIELSVLLLVGSVVLFTVGSIRAPPGPRPVLDAWEPGGKVK